MIHYYCAVVQLVLLILMYCTNENKRVKMMRKVKCTGSRTAVDFCPHIKSLSGKRQQHFRPTDPGITDIRKNMNIIRHALIPMLHADRFYFEKERMNSTESHK
ncbi:hypothetical protein Droror1_Dr00001937 [Drosera rotundifolia]